MAPLRNFRTEKAVNIAIRPYRAEDEPAVAALWRRVFPDAPAQNVPELDIRRKLQVQPELFLVALEGTRLAGTAMGGFDGHRGWIYYVAVRPDRRRRGVGRALMERIEAQLAARGCPKINLQVRGTNQQAAAFYRRLGYEIEDRISMGKKLESNDEG
jgi:ribosomal protein S18 acetylase RimI-like enzyme